MSQKHSLYRGNAIISHMRQFVAGVPHLVITKVRNAGWKKLAIGAGVTCVALLLLIQLFYPSNTLLPYTTVDGMSLGGKTKQQATTALNTAYANQTLAIYMGSGKKPVTSPKLSSLDGKVDNTTRINNMNYPWYMRLIPTSLFWAGHTAAATPAPAFGGKFDAYVSAHLMPDCQQPPVNASLKLSGESLTLIPSVMGGTCEQANVVKSIKAARPELTKETSVHVSRVEKAPAVLDKSANSLASVLNRRLKGGAKLSILDTMVTIAPKDILSWLDFTPDGNKLVASVNVDRAGDWLNKNTADKVAIKPGVTYVKTLDFTEVSRTDGTPGRAIGVPATVATLQRVIDGVDATASVATKAVPPSEQYTRTYSANDTGLSALMANYAHDHSGTFGVSMVELDGKKRRASYNADTQFVTASTYKLFVAYSLMKQIDGGQRDWDSNATCFNKMISYSDNACAEKFLYSIGLSTVTSDIQAIGLKSSTFMKSGGPYTTANDLTLLLGMIATGQNFSSTNQQRLISAMKANVYRQGIPAGVQGTVADKVGFLNGLLHDASIIYGPHGTYVLAIMTDGSTWGNIADLAKQIDTLHAQ